MLTEGACGPGGNLSLMADGGLAGRSYLNSHGADHSTLPSSRERKIAPLESVALGAPL